MARSAPTATYDDVNLVLRLYDMRREERLRKARSWFTAKFHVSSMEDVAALCPPGSDEDASMRMVIGYWEMVASFVASGVLNADLFFESGRELLLCWARVEPIVPGVRKMFADPAVWHNLEKVAGEYKAWLENRTPGSYEAFRARISNVR